jgi:hypothetical protein
MMITQRHEISQQQVIAALFHMEAGTQALLFGVLVERISSGWTWRIGKSKALLLLPAVDMLMFHSGFQGKPGFEEEETVCETNYRARPMR